METGAPLSFEQIENEGQLLNKPLQPTEVILLLRQKVTGAAVTGGWESPVAGLQLPKLPQRLRLVFTTPITSILPTDNFPQLLELRP